MLRNVQTVLVLLFLQKVRHFKKLIKHRVTSFAFFRISGVVWIVESLSFFSGSFIGELIGLIIAQKCFSVQYIMRFIEDFASRGHLRTSRNPKGVCVLRTHLTGSQEPQMAI